jgi:serine/threonine-protein kinase
LLDRVDDSAWRRAFREALVAGDAGKLKALARSPEALAQPPAVLSCLGDALGRVDLREEAGLLLRQAQQRHPGDFWINYLLGLFLAQPRTDEAVGYFRAAVAIRPASGQAHRMLGRVLQAQGDLDGAGRAFREAMALTPHEAAGKDLARVLAPQGRLEEARAAWEAALDHDPPGHDTWYGYAELCLFRGEEDAYRRARQALLRRFGETADPVVAERAGRACLLLPAAGEELDRAVALVDRALAAGPKHALYAYFQLAKGLAEYRQGRPERAIPLLQESASNIPQLTPRLVLAMAQSQAGAPEEARRTLAAAVRVYDWREDQADAVDRWICHALRREAELTVLPKLAPFLEGTCEPANNLERLELIGPCRFRHRHVAVARLYAEAFAADPSLANDLKARHRYQAACAAALVAAGQGEEARAIGERERTRWRRQVLDWLHADLAVWTQQLQTGPPETRAEVRRTLRRWQQEPQLSGLRTVDALATLPPEEREACRRFWAAVEALLRRTREVS